MKKLFLLLVVALPLMAQNGRVYLTPLVGQPYSEAVTTYATGQKDTVIWFREPSVSAISFVIHATDSVRFANDSGCVIIRIADGAMTKIAGDTLNLSAKLSTVDNNSATLSFTNGSVYYFTPTFSPYTDAIGFIVKYSHLAGNATSLPRPTVKYRVYKVYNEK